MRAVAVTEREAWDRALLALPNPHILQSWAWGELKARHGWRPTRLLFQQDGQTVGAASVLERRLPRLPAGILYVPKGPALDWHSPSPAGEVLAELERLARRRHAILIKIDPDVYYAENGVGDHAAAGRQRMDAAPGLSDLPPAGGSGAPGSDRASAEAGCAAELLARPACAPEVARWLARGGWRFSAEQVQFRNTLLLDLTRPEDELLAGMKQKTRYNVRLAQRRGVAVRPGSGADLDAVYSLYAETARRDGFIIRPPAYYQDAWGRFLADRLAHLLLAEVDGETVAALILFTFGRTAWYMYGASSDHHREAMPNYLLQWEAIRLARSLGCTLYDLWGAPEDLDEADPMWGVVRFKLGLGGALARGLGAWDYAPSRLRYWVYTVALPRYLGWLRFRGGRAF